MFMFMYINISYLHDVLFSILLPPFFFTETRALRRGPRAAWSDRGGDPNQASPEWGDQSVDGSLAGVEGQRRRTAPASWRGDMGGWDNTEFYLYIILYYIIYIIYT